MPKQYKNKVIANIMQRVIYTSSNERLSEELLKLTSQPLILLQNKLENYARIDNKLDGIIYSMNVNEMGELVIQFDSKDSRTALAIRNAIYNIFRNNSIIEGIKIEIPKSMAIGRKDIDSYLVHPAKFGKSNSICYLMAFREEKDTFIIKPYNPIPKYNSLYSYGELVYLLKLGMSANIVSVIVDYDRIQYNVPTLSYLSKAEKEIKSMIEWMSLVSTSKSKFILLNSDSLRRNNMTVVQKLT